ncbi:MAG: homoserine dehydrogenase [Dehalococcoidia bacterium]|nr:homoserine dehydrogenase [Dehalococcoidia bacterium]
MSYVVKDLSEINIGLMGLGIVGVGVARRLLSDKSQISSKTGRGLNLARVMVRDINKPRDIQISPDIITAEPEDIISDPSIDIIVEVIGGIDPAKSLIVKALTQGKHVVTANKEVVAKYGPELHRVAMDNHVNLLYEASVCGAIPVLSVLTNPLLSNTFRNVRGIINGTSNYILTDMAYNNAHFDIALKEAQSLGYAESDPTNDVDSFDAVYKLSILASLAFRCRVSPDDVYREGIRELKSQDFQYARELGYAIKCLAVADRKGDAVQARVYPALIPIDNMIAKVDGVYNAVEVSGDLCGQVLLHGLGAGREPTASAVLGDVIQIASQMSKDGLRSQFDYIENTYNVIPIDDLETRYYIRLVVTDTAGVLAQIAKILGSKGISIASVLQKDTFPEEQKAELVITTHPAYEASVQKALSEVNELDVVSDISNIIRIEG